MKAFATVLVFLLLVTPVVADTGFIDRLQFLFTGSVDVFESEVVGIPNTLTCDPCRTIVCGANEQFICQDTLSDCNEQYDSCKILTCDAPDEPVVIPPTPTTECRVDSDCPTLMCAAEPCPKNICVNGQCVTGPTPTCKGINGICSEMGNECCEGLICNTGIAADDVRGGNFQGRCAWPTQTCGDGVCQSHEEQTCPPCPSTDHPCTGVPCNANYCPQDCG